MDDVQIHRYTAGPQGAFVNAYLLETGEGVIAVDGTLTVSDGRALRSQLESLGKPLLAVLVTHAHPDHYGGIIELVAEDDVPVIATERVLSVIVRDDEIKEQILRPMFGDEWAATRTVPNRGVADGASLDFGAAQLTVIDLGPGESPGDSVWLLGEDRRNVFLGDQIYDGKHAYLADGFYGEWLANMELLQRELPSDSALYLGHGGPVTTLQFDWQRTYTQTFVDAIRDADWTNREAATASVVERMISLLPTDELQFLMELSIEPVAAKLGVLEAGGGNSRGPH